MSKELPVHEWGAIFLFSSVLIVIGLMSHFRQEPIQSKQFDQIQVRITGAVENPGYHFVMAGSTLRDLLPQITPLPETEPTGFSYDDLLSDGDQIRFKSSLLTVCIKGAVKQPVALELKRGSLLGESLEKIDLTDDADLTKVQYREIKRNRQTITIPRKKL